MCGLYEKEQILICRKGGTEYLSQTPTELRKRIGYRLRELAPAARDSQDAGSRNLDPIDLRSSTISNYSQHRLQL